VSTKFHTHTKWQAKLQFNYRFRIVNI
jgi:hypothetical protein